MKVSWQRAALFLALLAGALLAWLYLDGRIGPDPRGGRFLFDYRWSRATAGLGKPVAALWLLGLWAWVARRNRAAVTALAALLLSGIAVTPPKELFRRVRPSSTHMSPEELARPANYHRSRSFPSGDTAQAFAMATALSPGLALPWRAVLFGTAGIVGFKRFEDNAHYLSDVLAGAALGLLAGWIALALDRRLFGRAPPRFWRRRPWHFWLLVAAALGEPILDPYLFTHALVSWGPYLVVWLLLARGRHWLRWASDRAQPSRALLGLLCLAALSLLPGLSWSPARSAEENGGYLQAVTALHEAPSLLEALGSWTGAPLGPWLGSGIGALSPGPLRGARLLSGLAALAAVACLFALGRRLAGPRAGLLAGGSVPFSLAGGLLGRLAWPAVPLAACTLLAALGAWQLLESAGKRGRLLFASGAALGGLVGGAAGVLLPFLGLLLSALWSGRAAPLGPVLLCRLLPAALLPSLAWTGLAALGGAAAPLAAWLLPPTMEEAAGAASSPFLAPALLLAGLSPWIVAGLLSARFQGTAERRLRGAARAFLAGHLLALAVLLALPRAPLGWQAGLWLGPMLLATATLCGAAGRSAGKPLAAWAGANLLAVLLLWRFCGPW